MEFVTSAFSFSHTPSSHSSAVDNGWYFSLTPFPADGAAVPLFGEIVPYTAKVDTFTDVCDVQTSLSGASKVVHRSPVLHSQTLLFIVELSSATQDLVHEMCNEFKKFFGKYRNFHVGIVIVGSTVRFPIIRSNGKAFNIVTWPDPRTEVTVCHESIYFNLVDSYQQFLTYLDMIMEMPVEEPKISIHTFFYLFKSFIISLRNPVIVVTGDSLENDKTRLKLMGDEFFKLSVSCEFFIVGNDMRDPLNDFARQCNCNINYYRPKQRHLMISRLLKRLNQYRVIFTEVEIITSDSLQLKKILGRGKTLDNNERIFKLAKLTTNDTVHIFINPLFHKFSTIPPKITAVVRYFDRCMNCYKRIFPIDCTNYLTNPKALISSAAIKIILEKQNMSIINDLMQFDVSQYDSFFQQRFKFAVNSLKNLQTSSFLQNFCLSHHPNDIFDFLSPSCFDITQQKWKTMDNFLNPLIIFLPEHYYLCVFPDNSEYSEEDYKSFLFSIDPLYVYDIVSPSQYLENQHFIEIKKMISTQQ